jgi:hypothetical protein
MDVKDYSQQASKIKERYQDAAKDLRASFEKENDNVKETSEAKIKKQAAGYERDKLKMEEQARVNNAMYSDKTREAIERRQADYRDRMNTTTNKFDQEKNDMRQKYLDKLNDVTSTYQTSATESGRLHDLYMKFMNERFQKTTGELQDDYNTKIDKFSTNAQGAIRNEKTIDHEKRQDLASDYKSDLDNLRSKAAEKNFKEVTRLTDDNEKLRTNFTKTTDEANEQKEARINDILKLKKVESKDNQEHFKELRDKISEKEQNDQETTRTARVKDSKDFEQKYNEELKNIKKLANQKISSNGEAEGLKADNKRMRTVYENRIQNLGKNIQDDAQRMNEKENQNIVDTREKISNIKTKYNEEREVSDRERDYVQHKEMQKLTGKNTEDMDRLRDQSRVENVTFANHLEKKTKESKDLLKDQRLEFSKVVNNITEKNSENISTLKDSFAKDKTQIQVKNQIELSEEKRLMRDKLQQVLSERENLTQKKIDEIKKEADKMADNYEAKLEHISRENEKQMEMLRVTSAERTLKQEQSSSLALDLDKKERELENKNLRSHYERVIDKDRVISEQQKGRIMQAYEDQIDRERVAHQKEMSLRTNEAQMQMERIMKGAEVDKDNIRAQYEDKIENMKLATLQQVNSKKA